MICAQTSAAAVLYGLPPAWAARNAKKSNNLTKNSIFESILVTCTLRSINLRFVFAFELLLLLLLLHGKKVSV